MIWIDVRIPLADLQANAALIMRMERLSRVELDPPASGPEAQLSFGPWGVGAITGGVERALVADLRERGLDVLASRTKGNGWRSPA